MSQTNDTAAKASFKEAMGQYIEAENAEIGDVEAFKAVAAPSYLR